MHAFFRWPVIVLCALSGVVSIPAAAQTCSKFVTIVVPTATGGGHDFTARVIAERLAARLGKQVIVDNRAGGSGMVAGDTMSRSAPDGCTIMVSTPPVAVINALLQKNMSYDPRRDLAGITLAGMTPLVLVAHPSVPVKTLPDLIKVAKHEAGKLAYGTPGPASGQHIAGTWLSNLAGITLIHVPYKGAGPATIDVIAGQIPLAIVGMAPVLPHIKAGKLTAVAVMNKSRVQWLPNVQAVAESPGMKDFEVTHWMGVQVQGKTPPAIIKKLNGDFVEVLRMPEVRQALIGQGIDPVANSPEEFSAFLDREFQKYGNLVKLSGVTTE